MTSSGAAYKAEIVKFRHVVLYDCGSIAELGAPVLVVSCSNGDDRAVVDAAQTDDSECRRKSLVGSPMSRQWRTQNTRASGAYQLATDTGQVHVLRCRDGRRRRRSAASWTGRCRQVGTSDARQRHHTTMTLLEDFLRPLFAFINCRSRFSTTELSSFRKQQNIIRVVNEIWLLEFITLLNPMWNDFPAFLPFNFFFTARISLFLVNVKTRYFTIPRR